jgi:hypothetical protein
MNGLIWTDRIARLSNLKDTAMSNLRIVAKLGIGAALTAAGLVPAIAADVGPAPTTFMKWETIELPASTGASCGNGTPYRFFVNRTTNVANKNKTVVVFEGGGACWEQNTCLGKGGLLAASNPNGVPKNYMTSGLNLAVFGMSTPFSTRSGVLQKVQTQTWNIVYAPYCTGDVHSGNRVGTYADADATKPLTYFHKGGINGEAIANWLGTYMAKPDKLLVTGFSAGGTGATSNYGWIRLAMQPKQSALLADSGPLFPAPRDGDPAQYPSIPLQNKVRSAWGVDGPGGLATKMISRFPDAGTVDDLGSLTTGLAKVFPQDRLGFATFQQDGIYSDFSYSKFYPEIDKATGTARDKLLNVKWVKDVRNWADAMAPYSNIGYYIPYRRGLLKSHCLTIATFSGTGIKEANLANVGAFVDNLLDTSKPPIRAYETAP